jgi:cyclic pyranopterin phosphate synthase
MIAPLVDSFGRRHHNLRLSVTDRCNLRCTYCMPEDVEFLPKDHLLSFEELARVVTVAASLGVDKLRLTGGEPTLRQDLDQLVRMLVAVPGIKEIGLTTNGMLLEKFAGPLFDAGLRRLNVSLDSIDEGQFRVLTRRQGVERVLAGIAEAKRIGFPSIKINGVAIKGTTESQVVPLARYCLENGLELRFIEFMPLEADGVWDRSKVLTAEEILTILADAGLEAAPSPNADPNAPAEEFVYSNGGGKLGIIGSVSRPFCANCNRLRLTAEGKLRNCLFSLEETDLRDPMRSGANDDDLRNIFRKVVADKWAGHQINSPTYIRPLRTMHAIGG